MNIERDYCRGKVTSSVLTSLESRWLEKYKKKGETNEMQ